VSRIARRRRASSLRRPIIARDSVPNFVTGVNRTPIIPHPVIPHPVIPHPVIPHPNITNAQLDEQKIMHHPNVLKEGFFPVNLTILARTQATTSFLAYNEDHSITKQRFSITEIPTIGRLIMACEDFGVKATYDLDAQCKVALLCTITSHRGKVLWVEYIKLRTETGFPACATFDPEYTQFMMRAMEVASNMKVQL
jgi:hypothetical protein